MAANDIEVMFHDKVFDTVMAAIQPYTNKDPLIVLRALQTVFAIVFKLSGIEKNEVDSALKTICSSLVEECQGEITPEEVAVLFTDTTSHIHIVPHIGNRKTAFSLGKYSK
jgi:hypothetical protein